MTKIKIGRNDPCPCGSGKKHKKGCLHKLYSNDVMNTSLVGHQRSQNAVSYNRWKSNTLNYITRKEREMKKMCLGIAAIFVLVVFQSVETHAGEWFSCSPVEVMDQGNRVCVKCSNSHLAGREEETTRTDDQLLLLPRIRFIAVSTEDPARAERFISLASTAMACGYHFIVKIPVSSQTNVNHCDPSNCRTPEVFGIAK
jgi:hypothetical protein